VNLIFLLYTINHNYKFTGINLSNIHHQFLIVFFSSFHFFINFHLFFHFYQLIKFQRNSIYQNSNKINHINTLSVITKSIAILQLHKKNLLFIFNFLFFFYLFSLFSSKLSLKLSKSFLCFSKFLFIIN